MRASVLLAVVGLLPSHSLKPNHVTAAATPCTKAVAACERWIVFGGGPARSMVYASYPLDVANPAITRALVMVHGAGRNADHYFETSTAAAFLAGALENTIVIAPHFIATQEEKPAANEVMWPERGENWRSGGFSPSNPTINSFDFLDEIVRIQRHVIVKC